MGAAGGRVRDRGGWAATGWSAGGCWTTGERGAARDGTRLLLSALLSLVLGIGGGLVLARYVGAAARRDRDAADPVAAGELSRRVASLSGGGDAFDRLGARVNAMLDRVERLMGELRLVTDSLAHDLRSPLARLRARAEAALRRGRPAARDAALAGLMVETDLVMRMLSDAARDQPLGGDRARAARRDDPGRADRRDRRTVRPRGGGRGHRASTGDRADAPAAATPPRIAVARRSPI